MYSAGVLISLLYGIYFLSLIRRDICALARSSHYGGNVHNLFNKLIFSKYAYNEYILGRPLASMYHGLLC
jgi:hypothetical protein